MLRYHRSAARGLLCFGVVLGIATACSATDNEPGSAMSLPTDPQTSRSSARLGPEVSQGIASLRNATARFHNVGVAIAAGYEDPTRIPCVAIPTGAMGVHSVKGAALDQSVVPDQPEALLFLPRKGGGFKLVAVEYLVPALVRNTVTGVVSPWFSPAPWGSGYALVTTRPSVFGEAFEGPMPGHEPSMPWHYDKHVWVWETNPSGMFSQWNPSISCP